MTIDLDALEALYISRKFTLGSVPDTVLELIAELRKAQAGRDWLAETLEKMNDTLCELGLQCGKMYHVPRTKAEWIEISHKAVEEQKP